MASKYKLSIGLKKSLIKSLIVAIPVIATVLIEQIPVDIKDMSVGGALLYVTSFAVNWLKNK